MKIQFYLIIFLFLTACSTPKQDHSKTYLFVGSYTSGEKAEGIYVYELNTETGQLTGVEKEDNLINPSFLTISPNGKFIYACTETNLEKDGSISAFEIDSLTGKITFLNKQSTGGRNPVHVVVNKTNKHVIGSNYNDAGISIFKCNADGSLQKSTQLIEFEGNSIVEGRQDEAHMHSVTFSPDNDYVFAPDLGSDKIRAFSFDDEDLLTIVDSLTIETKKGAGPRHFTFHPNGKFAYCIEELTGSVSFYNYKNGQLNLSNTYRSYEHEEEGYSSADIHVSPDGKHLYASNRQDENSISIFEINQKDGSLSLNGHQSTFGRIPRSFVLDPTGEFLIVANQKSSEIIVFNRNIETGLLTKISTITEVEFPSSLKMIKYSIK